MTSHPSLQKYVGIIIPSFSYTAKTITQELTRYSESRKADNAARAARVRAESAVKTRFPILLLAPHRCPHPQTAARH
jgi:hypothetical protein